MGTTRSYDESPGLGGLYARTVRATLQQRAAGGEGEELRLELPSLRVDPAHLAAYAEVTGFPAAAATLPVTYPHVLAFPLHLDLMSDPGFPFKPMGIVHLANTITQHKPVPADAELSIEVGAGPHRPHSKGTVFDVVSEVRADGELVWTDTTTLLSRGSGTEDASPDLLPDPQVPATAEWELEGNLGRRYAAASGDRNPIHLFRITAQAFGFKRQIAHGMWAKAAALSQLGDALPDAFTVRVDFRKPLLLPSRVRYGHRTGDAGIVDFALYDAGDPDVTHLIGRITPA